MKRILSILIALVVFPAMAFATGTGDFNDIGFSVTASDNWGCDSFSGRVTDSDAEEIEGIVGATVEIYRLASKEESGGEHPQIW